MCGSLRWLCAPLHARTADNLSRGLPLCLSGFFRDPKSASPWQCGQSASLLVRPDFGDLFERIPLQDRSGRRSRCKRAAICSRWLGSPAWACRKIQFPWCVLDPQGFLQRGPSCWLPILQRVHCLAARRRQHVHPLDDCLPELNPATLIFWPVGKRNRPPAAARGLALRRELVVVAAHQPACVVQLV